MMTKNDLYRFLVDKGVDEVKAKTASGFEYIGEYRDAEDFNGSFACVYLSKNPKRPGVVKQVCDALGKKRVEWSDLNAMTLTDVKMYLDKSPKLCANSVKTILRTIQAVANIGISAGLMKCDTQTLCKVMTHKSEETENISLTAEELNAWWNFRNSDVLRDNPLWFEVWHDFMLCAYLGCRHSDLAVISPKCIKTKKDVNGNDVKIVEYISIKEKIKAFPPLHPNALWLMNKEVKHGEYYPTTVMYILRTIGKRCGMTQPVTIHRGCKDRTEPKYKLIGTHTARHTFATLMACGRHPVPETEIAKYMGHRSVNITHGYIVGAAMPVTVDAVANFM